MKPLVSWCARARLAWCLAGLGCLAGPASFGVGCAPVDLEPPPDTGVQADAGLQTDSGVQADADAVDQQDGADATPRFAAVAETLAGTCGEAYCHGENHNGNFHIEGGTSAEPAAVQRSLEGVDSLSGMALVAPGNPDESAVYLRISSDGSAESGNVMPPPPNPPLSQEKIDQIRDWIAEGASYDAE